LLLRIVHEPHRLDLTLPESMVGLTVNCTGSPPPAIEPVVIAQFQTAVLLIRRAGLLLDLLGRLVVLLGHHFDSYTSTVAIT
jgi:hypothetical protein